jgi:ParB family chromosome partitioning protein
VSLSENLGQEAMHPIDEFNAYAAMEKEGKTAEAIAQRFGVTVLHVQRRMRLAAVAPTLLALYRDEKATLDQMMALATVDDPKRQVAVWNSLPDYNRNPATIRRRLTEEEVHCADPRVKLITLERYIASGGTTRLDLFGTPGDEFLTDAGLVDLIVAEVLEEHAAKARAEGWGFVEVLPEFGHDERARFVQAPKVYKPEPPEVSQQREAIEAQRDQAYARIDAIYEAEDSDAEAQDENDGKEIERLQDEIEVHDAALQALHETLLDTTSTAKAGQGVVITFEGGKIKMHCGLVTAKQAQATAKLAVASGGSTDANGKPVTARAEVPERLMLNLTAQSTAATQALLIANQSTALAVLAHRLALAVFDVGYHDHPAKLSLTPCMSTLERNSPSLPASRAAGLISAEHEHWKQALPAHRDQWLAWLLTQPAEVVLRLLTYLCAVSYDAQKGTERTQPVHHQVAQAVSLDMADWWEANPANYLELVPKAKMIEAVTEAVGAPAATDMEKMKKAEAQAHAAAKLQGTRWLPAPLRRSQLQSEQGPTQST